MASASPAIDQQLFRTVLGHLPTGVTVVTAFDGDEPVGMACNSVSSVSLDPPLILFCPARTSTTWPAIQRAGRFCVNVMASHHADACRYFSLRDVDRFEAVDWHSRLHGPGVDDAVAWIECEIAAEHEAGDHLIVVGRVDALSTGPGQKEPLVFCRGVYGRPTNGGGG